nr:major capsid protein [Escherichia coli]
MLWPEAASDETKKRTAFARYPKNWVTTGDPAREFTMIQSAPLMLLADPDEFVSVQLA